MNCGKKIIYLIIYNNHDYNVSYSYTYPINYCDIEKVITILCSTYLTIYQHSNNYPLGSSVCIYRNYHGTPDKNIYVSDYINNCLNLVAKHGYSYISRSSTNLNKINQTFCIEVYIHNNDVELKRYDMNFVYNIMNKGIRL